MKHITKTTSQDAMLSHSETIKKNEKVSKTKYTVLQKNSER